MEVLALVSLAGGMGRTTTALHVALALSAYGRVLVVDLDPQASCTAWLGGGLAVTEPSGLEVLNGTVAVHRALRNLGRNLWLLPADRALGLQADQLPPYDQELLLQHKLRLLAGEFAYCVVDTMAGKSLLTVMACCAAQWLVIPVEMSPKGVLALGDTLAFLDELQGHSLPVGKVLGILPVRDQWIGRRRIKLGVEVLKTMSSKTQNHFFTPVRETLRLKQFGPETTLLEGTLGGPFLEVVQALHAEQTGGQDR
ncbi:ParA family protein [Anthocerotibacter panamensis]|uniref:ParA family protein n=1 Tax=Anthocerotibacter panamensis TaxID=2857077 RepID=UPI001C408CA1|nr:ParA family protein [Anthocerotibacter panamensis]